MIIMRREKTLNEKDLKELIKSQLREEIEKNKRQISSLNDKRHENEVANLESRNEWLEDMLYRK